jgi:hypothetical protein
MHAEETECVVYHPVSRIKPDLEVERLSHTATGHGKAFTISRSSCCVIHTTMEDAIIKVPWPPPYCQTHVPSAIDITTSIPRLYPPHYFTYYWIYLVLMKKHLPATIFDLRRDEDHCSPCRPLPFGFLRCI